MFRTQRAEVYAAQTQVVGPIDWELWAGEAQALVGLGGSGKSLLLQLLSGRRPRQIESRGEWTFDGRPLAPAWERDEPLPESAWMPQVRNASSEILSAEQLATKMAQLDAAFYSKATVLLLDEPERGLPEPERARLADRLRAHCAAGGAALVVTHHLGFAECFASRVAVLAGGRIQMRSAEAFFADPCVVPDYDAKDVGWEMELPASFKWLDEGRIAGCGRPGLMRGIDEDLLALASHGVTLLVTLTEDALARHRLRPYGLDTWHFPIRDMTAPVSTAGVIGLVMRIREAMKRGEVIAIHCAAGVGRTGMLLACVAVAEGLDATSAIAKVRAINSLYIQTPAQENFVSHFEEDLRASD